MPVPCRGGGAEVPSSFMGTCRTPPRALGVAMLVGDIADAENDRLLAHVVTELGTGAVHGAHGACALACRYAVGLQLTADIAPHDDATADAAAWP